MNHWRHVTRCSCNKINIWKMEASQRFIYVHVSKGKNVCADVVFPWTLHVTLPSDVCAVCLLCMRQALKPLGLVKPGQMNRSKECTCFPSARSCRTGLTGSKTEQVAQLNLDRCSDGVLWLASTLIRASFLFISLCVVSMGWSAFCGTCPVTWHRRVEIWSLGGSALACRTRELATTRQWKRTSG